MAYDIVDKPNTDGPDGTYPYGNIRDNAGAGDGTPVNTLVYADFHQFFARLMAIAGVVANGLPDNAANGFQLFVALGAYINSLTATAVAAEAAIRGSADTTLQNNINLKADIASPALTGNPTAPTQSAGNNSTRLATTAYTDGAVATEASNRGSADTTLQNNINAEAVTRAGADSAESAARIAADNLKANIAQAAWTAISLTPGAWSADGTSPPEKRSDTIGQVHLRGKADYLSPGDLGSGFPAHATKTIRVTVYNLTGDEIALLSIDPGGNGIITFSTSSGNISLDGVSYWTD
jgi:hypothetical protein